MSVNRNANIIKAIKGKDRDPIRYNFSASLWAIGGGASGVDGVASLLGAGGGGGAGAVVSSSISIVPNITWNVQVGGGGVSNSSGEDTYAVAYNDDYDGLVTFRAQGGRVGSGGTGGNTGSGSLEISATTQSYSAFTGGADTTGGNRNAAGGGAGVTQDGQTGTTYDGNPGSGIGGVGGTGLNNTNQLSLPIIGPIAGGGGGAASDTADTQIGGIGRDGGGDGGFQNDTYNGEDASSLGSGGGGGGTVGPGQGGDGYDGGFVISFNGIIGTQLGQYDIQTTNATILRDEPTNTTVILFNSGSGTFRYNAPFPYDKRP